MIYSVVPARSGSKSVKDKNIKMLGGKPVIAHSIETSNKCKLINSCIFTSDSDHYIQLAKNWGAKQTIKRPDILATDTSCDIDYLLHLIYTIPLNIEDIIVLLRPTTPLRDNNIINNAITYFMEEIDIQKNIHSMRSMHKLNESPEKMFKYSDIKFVQPYMGNSIEDANKPKESFSSCYQPNGYIDILTVKTILETKTVFGTNVLGFNTEKVIDIDSQEDFNYLEYIMNKKD